MITLRSKTEAEAARQASMAKVGQALNDYSDYLNQFDLSIANQGINEKLNAAQKILYGKIIDSQSETNLLGAIVGWFKDIENRPDLNPKPPLDPNGIYMVTDPRVVVPVVSRTSFGPQVRFEHPYEWLAPGDTNPDDFPSIINGVPVRKELVHLAFGDVHYWIEKG